MCAFPRNQSPIARTTWQKVHQSLQASEPGLRGVLVLVRPRLVRRKIAAIMELYVHSVEGNDEIRRRVHFLEGRDDSKLGVPFCFVLKRNWIDKRSWKACI